MNYKRMQTNKKHTKNLRTFFRSVTSERNWLIDPPSIFTPPLLAAHKLAALRGAYRSAMSVVRSPACCLLLLFPLACGQPPQILRPVHGLLQDFCPPVRFQQLRGNAPAVAVGCFFSYHLRQAVGLAVCGRKGRHPKLLIICTGGQNSMELP